MYFRRLHLALAIVLLTALPLSAQVQKPAEVWTEWETLSPENEEFTVLMPKNPTTEATTFPYHKMELNARLISRDIVVRTGARDRFVERHQIEPAQFTPTLRVSILTSMHSKTSSRRRFEPKRALTKMTLVSSRPFHGHTGRSYKLTIGDLSGSLNALLTEKRFYVIVSLNTKKDEALEEKFLSSFVLPERAG